MIKFSCLITLSLFVVVPLVTQAQEDSAKTYLKKYNYADVAFSLGDSHGSGAFSLFHNHVFGKKGRFKIGYGLRFTSYFGLKKEYITAPAKLTSKQEGPQVLFSKTYEENLDTLVLGNPETHLLNLMINLEYNVYKKFDLGLNIDAIGFSFGPLKKAEYRSSLREAAGYPMYVHGEPTPFNLLLVSDNDLGSLNSEFYVRYRLNQQVGVKAGYTFLFSEFTTHTKLLMDNDRFRQKIGIFMIGVTYALNKN